MAIPLFAGVAVPASMLATYGPEWARFFAIGLAELAIDWSLIWMKWTDLGVLHPAVGAGGAALLGASVFLYKHPWWALLLGTVAMVRTDVRTTNFELTFPDVGQGGAALVGLPDGRKWLIDGGPPSNKLLFWLRRKGVRRLDTIFLTHPDTDHLGGLIPIIESLEVDTLWAPRRPRPDESQFHNFWRRAAQRGVTLRTVKEDVDGNTNENSLVIQLRHGTHRFLLTGDIGVETERRMIPHLSTYTVVQVPHHGSLGSSSEDFVRQTKPTFAVIQAGEKNRYGHPHPKVVDRWGTKRVLRTDHHGSIEFESDGLRLQTKTTQPKKLTLE